MGSKTKIQWAQSSWNPWHGCKKVSPGCKFCYMYRDKERWKQDPTTVLRSKSGFRDPLKWKEPKLIFTCSWSDWFIEEADEWRDEAWEIIKNTPHHTYQILTKRPERIKDCLPDDWGDGYPNVWLGVSAENSSFLTRVIHLNEVPAKVRFLSAEPLIDTLYGWKYLYQIDHYLSNNMLDWVIVGGESGNENGKYQYRPCNIEWIQSIVDSCKSYRVPVFVKQLGTYLSKDYMLKDRHGGDIDEWIANPFLKDIAVRQMPEACHINELLNS